MNYVRKLIRFLFGVTAEKFNVAQEKELMELLKDQENQANSFISDVSTDMCNKVTAMAVLAEAIAKDKDTLTKLRGE